MGDITVKTRILEQCRSTGGEDDYDLVDYTFSEYVPASDAINHICGDKHKRITLEWNDANDSGITRLFEPVILFFERNEEGEFICKTDPDHKSARDILRETYCNWVVAKKEQEHVWITLKDWIHIDTQ